MELKVANQDGRDRGNVFLDWESDSQLTTYTVYRSSTTDNRSLEVASELQTTYLLDKQVKPGITYYYWVQSKQAGMVGPVQITVNDQTPYYEKLRDDKYRFTFYPSKYNLYKSELPAETQIFVAGEMNNWGRPSDSLNQDQINSKHMDQLQEVGNVWSGIVDLSNLAKKNINSAKYKWYVDFGREIRWYGLNGDSLENYPYPIGAEDLDDYELHLYVKLDEEAQHPYFWQKSNQYG